MRKAAFLFSHFICVLSFNAKTADSSQEISDTSSNFNTSDETAEHVSMDMSIFLRGAPAGHTGAAQPQRDDSFEAPPTFQLRAFVDRKQLVPVAAPARASEAFARINEDPLPGPGEKSIHFDIQTAEELPISSVSPRQETATHGAASSATISPLTPRSTPDPDNADEALFRTPLHERQSLALAAHGGEPPLDWVTERTESFASTVNISEAPLEFPATPLQQTNADASRETHQPSSKKSLNFSLISDVSTHQSTDLFDLSASTINLSPEGATAIDDSVADDRFSLEALFSDEDRYEEEDADETEEENQSIAQAPAPMAPPAITLSAVPPTNAAPSPAKKAASAVSAPARATPAPKPRASTPAKEIRNITPPTSPLELRAPMRNDSLSSPPSIHLVGASAVEIASAPTPAKSIEKSEADAFTPPASSPPLPLAASDYHQPLAVAPEPASIVPTELAGASTLSLFALAIYKHLLIARLKGKLATSGSLKASEAEQLRSLKQWRLGAGAGSAFMLALTLYLHNNH